MTTRPRVGFLSVPHGGVPPRRLGSVNHVVHEITRRLPDLADLDLTVVSGDHDRAPERQHPSVRYHALSTRPDRWWGDRVNAWRHRNDPRHPFHRAGFHASFARRAARRLARCDIVFCHVFAQWLPTLRQQLPNATLYLWAHDATFAEPEVADDAWFEPADGLIGCSQWVVDQFIQRVPRVESNAHAIHNGYDPDVFHPGVAETASPPRILYAGRLTPEKGAHVLVDAFRLLADDHPDVQLDLVGPAWHTPPSLLRGLPEEHRADVESFWGQDYVAALRQRAGPHSRRVHFRGSLDHHDLAIAYARATVFVHPALWHEPFGMPVLEAMACGTPVIVTQRGGMPEFVRGASSRLITAGSVEALREGLDWAVGGSGHPLPSVDGMGWDAAARRLASLIP